MFAIFFVPLHPSLEVPISYQTLGKHGGVPKDHPRIAQGSPKDGCKKMTRYTHILYNT